MGMHRRDRLQRCWGLHKRWWVNNAHDSAVYACLTVTGRESDGDVGDYLQSTCRFRQAGRCLSPPESLVRSVMAQKLASNDSRIKCLHII